MSKEIFALVAKELNLRPDQVQNVAQLLDDGWTVPFMLHYRKELTGGLDEERLRGIEDGLRRYRELAERRQTILRALREQDRLTDELAQAIDEADSPTRLEDLYVAYRPKKRTLAATARAQGLGPLAEAVERGMPGGVSLDEAAKAYVDPEKNLRNGANVLAGAAHIIANRVYEDPQVRARVRQALWDIGKLVSTKGPRADPQAKEFKDYFQFEDATGRISSQRVLTINRGEARHALKVKVVAPENELVTVVNAQLGWQGHPQQEFLDGCVHDCLRRLLVPFLEREIRTQLTAIAERDLVRSLARRLRAWLMQVPVRDKTVLAIVPGYRVGCTLAVLSPQGALIEDAVVFPHQPQNQREEAKQTIRTLISTHGVGVVALGRGTASYETEELLAELFAGEGTELSYALVNEAGASVYAASRLAKEELPDKDAPVRGAVSVGRRLQNPLVELTKVDPQHLVVGQYQHELQSDRVRTALSAVARSCVHEVGADANTAGASFLRHVAGLTAETARCLVEYREQHGPFRSREQLRQVPGMSGAAFTQSAGFLRVHDGDEPLDATRIHPENYPACERLLQDLGHAREDVTGEAGHARLAEALKSVQPRETAERLGIGEWALKDILTELAHPGRDPRDSRPGAMLRKGPVRLDDLRPGVPLCGTVRNVVDFGVFVDVGLHEDGLVHISRMADRFVSSPHDVVAVGEELDVWVVEVDAERQRVALTMIPPDSGERPRRPAAAARPRPKKKPKKKGRPSKPEVTPPKSDSTRLTYRPFADLAKLMGRDPDPPKE